ncbi:MAG: SEC-C metal-binding domain-containing protein, partial [Acidimicrobiales bacterium]
EGLAMQDVVAQGLDPTSEEGQSRFADLLAKYQETCRAEGERVRELGGLYVLGSERHESRRIDNQLRGRSGRQGDPGESRFYLSLEDDLLRLFAGGTLNWVMQRTFPDDLPIEAKMVNRAIERAQSTVEGKNAEIRKEVLKYDEVLNQQRKVIYDLRLGVLEGDDLFDRTLEILDEVLLGEIDAYCEREFQEEWDLEGLVGAIRMIWPTKFEVGDLEEATTKEQLFESLRAEAIAHYEEKEERLPGGSEMARDIEREVMLTVIDQKWREHLADMDYLREGINLRAMGQQDPLVAWQREGFAMFTEMMSAIDADYLRYVMQVEVVQATPEGVDFEQASYSGATDPGDLSLIGGFNPVPLETLMGSMESSSDEPSGATGFDPMGESQVPLVKDENTKLGRNDPCWCGSGSKYKFCHGRTN